MFAIGAHTALADNLSVFETENWLGVAGAERLEDAHFFNQTEIEIGEIFNLEVGLAC